MKVLAVTIFDIINFNLQDYFYLGAAMYNESHDRFDPVTQQYFVPLTQPFATELMLRNIGTIKEIEIT